MKRLLPIVTAEEPWYPDSLTGVQALPRNAECTRCIRGPTCRNPCLPPDGPEGAALVVLGSVDDADDHKGTISDQRWDRKCAADALRARGIIVPIRWTAAVRCAGNSAPTKEMIQACRPYLAGELQARPSRIVLVGQLAVRAALGWDIGLQANTQRRAWGHLAGVPFFSVMAPFRGSYNDVYRRWFAEDFVWALTTAEPQPADGTIEVLWEADRAVEWLRENARPDVPLVIDAEHWPNNVWTPGEFRVLCLGLCTDPAAPVVIPEETLKFPQVLHELKRAMEDPRVPKVNQMIKHDIHVLWRAFGIDLQGIEWCTMTMQGVLDSEAPRALKATAWLVGMGGYKEAGLDDRGDGGKVDDEKIVEDGAERHG